MNGAYEHNNPGVPLFANKLRAQACQLVVRD